MDSSIIMGLDYRISGYPAARAWQLADCHGASYRKFHPGVSRRQVFSTGIVALIRRDGLQKVTDGRYIYRINACDNVRVFISVTVYRNLSLFCSKRQLVSRILTRCRPNVT